MLYVFKTKHEREGRSIYIVPTTNDRSHYGGLGMEVRKVEPLIEWMIRSI